MYLHALAYQHWSMFDRSHLLLDQMRNHCYRPQRDSLHLYSLRHLMNYSLLLLFSYSLLTASTFIVPDVPYSSDQSGDHASCIALS